MDLQHLRASDGTGEAVLAHIQSVRNPGSTVLDLDNVDNWNSKAIVVTGTPNANGFISAAGMKVMYGHLNAGDFIIDGYAPGYTDNGNQTTEVAIVKMTTNWADALVDILKNTLTDAGKIKTDAIDSETMFADGVDPVKRTSELMFDHVASGLVYTGDNYNVNRNASLTSGVVYINGRRLTVAAVAARTFTASKDTYVDVLDAGNGTGTLVYTEVANNAASPALAANSIRIGIIVTGASAIVSAAYVNQGQETAQWPQSDSNTVYVMTTDTLGNLICSRDPLRKVLGYRQITSGTQSTGTTGNGVAITGLKCPVKVPAGRKVKVSIGTAFLYNSVAGSRANLNIWESSVGGTQLAEGHGVSVNSSSAQSGYVERTYTPTNSNPTYLGGLAANPGNTATIETYSYMPGFIKVELE